MPLASVRKKFVEISGRFDLVVDPASFKDNGADFFLQAGQTFLDNFVEFDKGFATYEVPLVAGVDTVLLPQVRAVKAVYHRRADGDYLLSPFQEVQHFYGGVGEAPLEGSVPAYYKVFSPRTPPSPSVLTETRSAIQISYTEEIDTVLVIEGLFYSPKLERDEDFSFWTEQHPDILIQAALYKMESFYGNTQGTQDYLSALRESILGLDYNVVEGMLNDRNVMRDAW